MRKRIINQGDLQQDRQDWIDTTTVAQVEITSEDSACPIESALTSRNSSGWKVAQLGVQTVRILFDEPQRIKRIHLQFDETTKSRTQEFVLCWSTDDRKPYQEILRQQYTFSPPDTTCEIEDYNVDLHEVSVLELRIVPDISGGSAHASLSKLQIA